MDIFGIGPMELILILIVALMVFGPDKLPQIGAKLGRGMRDMRKATRAISTEINATRAAIDAPVKELTEPFQEVAGAAKAASSALAAAKTPGQALRDSVLKELNTPVAVPAEPAPAEESAPTEPAPPAEPENTIAPPLATQQAAVAVVAEGPLALPEPDEMLALPAPQAPDDAILPPTDEHATDDLAPADSSSDDTPASAPPPSPTGAHPAAAEQ